MASQDSAPHGSATPLEVVVVEASGPFEQVVLRNNSAKTITACAFVARCKYPKNPNEVAGARTELAGSLAYSTGGIHVGMTTERSIQLGGRDASAPSITVTDQVVAEWVVAPVVKTKIGNP